MSRVRLFETEYEWLKKNIPEALFKGQLSDSCYTKCPSIEDAINRYQHWLHHRHLNFNNNDLYIEKINQCDDQKDLITGLQASYFQNNMLADKQNDPVYSQNVSQRGCDFLGMYVSMHTNFNDQKYPWGIYLFPEGIKYATLELFQDNSLLRLSIQDYIKLMVYAVFRHEVFHYQVEKFTTDQEISQRRNLYLPYKKTVYCYYYLTEYCLEEALAESAVHKSKFVKDNLGIDSSDINIILETHSNSLPAGYKDYRCGRFNGEENAHQILSSQIIKTTPYSDVNFTSPMTVKTEEFINNGLNVPLYVVVPAGQVRYNLADAIRVTGRL